MARGYTFRTRQEDEVYSFPCDSSGCVNIDKLSECARSNCFSARTVIGRDFAMPAAQPCDLH